MKTPIISNNGSIPAIPSIAEFTRVGDGGRPLGAILLDSGKITVDEAERIMHLQKEQGMRFGDAAIALGIITEADVQRALARQFNYPYLINGDDGASAELVAAFSPFSPQVEALRGLRSQLMLRWFSADIHHKTLAIISPGRNEGRSYLAANLAIVFSQLGERTLLIDADMRNPRQHSLFQLENRTGLSGVLAGQGSDSGVPHRIPNFIDLSVLTAGVTPPNPQELLGRSLFHRVIEQFESQYDVILIDTPSGNDYADAQMVSSFVGGTLMVTRRDHTKVKAANLLAANMRQFGVTLIGSVLSEF
jgi:protein-tyrosine kinase